MKHLHKQFELLFSFGGVVLILFSCFVAASSFIHQNLDFHTDIARDFLLFEDLVFGKHITLIGPRAGGISGVFHGPLWLYLNLPAFILGQGNPVIVGWFWFFLFLTGIVIYVVIGHKLFNGTSAAILSGALFAATHATSVQALFNPYGAVLLYPIFLYHAVQFEKIKRMKHIIWAVLSIGFAVQFQMAFAVPIMVLFILRLLYEVVYSRKYIYLLPLSLFLIPLSTFIAFDVRHHFLQLRSVATYLSQGGGSEDVASISFMALAKIRVIQAFIEVGGVYTRYESVATAILLIMIVWCRKSIKSTHVHMWNVLMYYYFGYWIVTLPYRGTIWGYYYWPFIGSLGISIVLLVQNIPYRYGVAIKSTIYIVLIMQLVHHMQTSSLIQGDREGWRLYYHTADRVLDSAPSEFGYYVYSNDQYGYSMKYAIHYALRHDLHKMGFSFQKKATTYLFIDDPGTHKYTNHRDWKKNDVKITTDPISRVTSAPHFWVEKYKLTPSQQQITSNPNLIQDLIFR